MTWLCCLWNVSQVRNSPVSQFLFSVRNPPHCPVFDSLHNSGIILDKAKTVDYGEKYEKNPGFFKNTKLSWKQWRKQENKRFGFLCGQDWAETKGMSIQSPHKHDKVCVCVSVCARILVYVCMHDCTCKPVQQWTKASLHIHLQWTKLPTGDIF